MSHDLTELGKGTYERYKEMVSEEGSVKATLKTANKTIARQFLDHPANRL